jgi:cyclophilin family peptidyl-prolyl cis-trans isomerase
MRFSILLITIVLAFLLAGCSLLQKTDKISSYVLMDTSKGRLVFALYESTPLHSKHFENLCKTAYYDSLLFHKTIPEGIVLGGDTESKHTDSHKEIKSYEVDSNLTPEISTKRHNLRGTLGAWRAPDDLNPDMLSNPSVFYIAHGSTFTESQLNLMTTRKNLPKITDFMTTYLEKEENIPLRDSMLFYREQRMNEDYTRLFVKTRETIKPLMKEKGIDLLELSKKQYKLYTEKPGIPYMDGAYTIFGKLVSGFDVLDEISNVRTGLFNRPNTNIYILSTEVLSPKEWKQMKKNETINDKD